MEGEIKVEVRDCYGAVVSAGAPEAIQMEWGLGGAVAPEHLEPMYRHSHLRIICGEIVIYECGNFPLWMCFHFAAVEFEGNDKVLQALAEKFEEEQGRKE